MMNGTFGVAAWSFGRIIANIINFRRPYGDSHLFSRQVLGIGLLLGLTSYKYAFELMSTMNLVFVDKALLSVENDRQLSLYRVRLLTYKPEYANSGFRKHDVVDFDGLNFDKKEEVKELQSIKVFDDTEEKKLD